MKILLCSMSNDQQKKYTKLSGSEIESAISSLEAWSMKDSKLHRSFKFKTFVGDFSFMTEVALHAEKMDHHPTWTNTWNVVSFELSTHDAGDVVTDKDKKLAKAIDQLVG